MSAITANWPKQYDAVFSKLAKVTPGGTPGNWKACCPAHEDKNPSLSIKLGDNGRLLICCCRGGVGNGCSNQAILNAMGLTMSNLFPDGQQPAVRSRVVKVYDYKRGGVLLAQTVRFDPKKFSQRRPNPDFDAAKPEGKGNERFLWNLQGVPRDLLYREDDVLEALTAKPGRAVFVVEGEKDVDTLWDLGFVATCNQMGAGKWRQEHADKLRDCNVFVVPDVDPLDAKTGKGVGQEHGLAVFASVKPVAKSAFLLWLPPADAGNKQDITAFLEGYPPAERKAAVITQCERAKAAAANMTAIEKTFDAKPVQEETGRADVPAGPPSRSAAEVGPFAAEPNQPIAKLEQSLGGIVLGYQALLFAVGGCKGFSNRGAVLDAARDLAKAAGRMADLLQLSTRPAGGFHDDSGEQDPGQDPGAIG